jgi:hypothetical protein
MGSEEVVHMADIEDTKEEDWEESENNIEEIPDSETDNIMKFSDFVDPQEKHRQKQRITDIRRRVEERQDWKQITGEFDVDLDEEVEEVEEV